MLEKLNSKVNKLRLFRGYKVNHTDHLLLRKRTENVKSYRTNLMAE